MIDLNYRRQETKRDDTPIGAMIIVLLPMVWAFWSLIEWGLR